MKEISQRRSGASLDQRPTATGRDALRPSNRRNDTLRPGEERTGRTSRQEVKRGRQLVIQPETFVPGSAGDEQSASTRLELKRGKLTLTPLRDLSAQPQGGQEGQTEHLRKNLAGDKPSLITGEEPTHLTKQSPGDLPSTTTEDETTEAKQLREKLAKDPSSDLVGRRGPGDSPEDLQTMSRMKDDKSEDESWLDKNMPENISQEAADKILQRRQALEEYGERLDRQRGN